MPLSLDRVDGAWLDISPKPCPVSVPSYAHINTYVKVAILVARQLPWTVEFYLHSDRSVPAIDFLSRCPVASRIEAIAEAVRAYPPPSFPPSQMWHVMSGAMRGLYEIRVRNRQTLHRLFCLLDANASAHGLDRPAMVPLSVEPSPSVRRCPATRMPTRPPTETGTTQVLAGPSFRSPGRRASPAHSSRHKRLTRLKVLIGFPYRQQFGSG